MNYYLDGIPVDLGMRKEASSYQKILEKITTRFPKMHISKATELANQTYGRKIEKAMSRRLEKKFNRAQKAFIKNPSIVTLENAHNATPSFTFDFPTRDGRHILSIGNNRTTKGMGAWIKNSDDNLIVDGLVEADKRRKLYRKGETYTKDGHIIFSPFKHFKY